MDGVATGKLRIISRSGEPFKNRQEAGRLLSEELKSYQSPKAVALGIPRGGVIVAQEIARILNADLDIVLTRKLRAPGQPELAIGSVAENGKLFLNDYVVRGLGIGQAYIQQEKQFQMAEIKRRSDLFRRVYPRVPLAGRIVILTDDGVATGATTQAAIWAVRHEEPGKLIAAFPVGSEETLKRLAGDVDEMVCLRVPLFFSAVGQFYEYFEAVEDDEVLKILAEWGKGAKSP